jgi:hypothetical protein
MRKNSQRLNVKKSWHQLRNTDTMVIHYQDVFKLAVTVNVLNRRPVSVYHYPSASSAITGGWPDNSVFSFSDSPIRSGNDKFIVTMNLDVERFNEQFSYKEGW